MESALAAPKLWIKLHDTQGRHDGVPLFLPTWVDFIWSMGPKARGGRVGIILGHVLSNHALVLIGSPLG